jgi:nucleotide-binding universal stress UspA family protein
MPADITVFGYDGSAAADLAIAEAGALLKTPRALVAAVWEAGAGYEAVDIPTTSLGMPAAPIDVRTAQEIDRSLYERAQRLAEQGAERARAAGFEAEGIAVADDVTVHETLSRLADERDARAIVVGHRGHGRLTQMLLGSTARELVRTSRRPVLVVRGPDD